MKRSKQFAAGLLLAVMSGAVALGQTNIISDNYNVTTATTGFAVNNGVNFGINPPSATRLTGTAAPNLRYIQTATGKPTTVFGIETNRLRIATNSGIGRFTLSANGSTAYDFSSALATLGASPTNPAVYELRIGMRNDATSNARFSFGIATAEGDVTTWDFGVQLFHGTSGDDFYTIQRRIDNGSSGVGDVNQPIGTTAAATWQTFINFLIRITDAGAETSTYSSRVQVSIDNGSNWVYDSTTDPQLPNGFRFDSAGRVIIWDQAGNVSGTAWYDDFSVTWISGPPLPPTGATKTWTGAGGDDNWNTGANWAGGVAPTNSDQLIFSGATRQSNTNDIVDLTVPTVTFNNGGFTLYGNVFTNTSTISNLAGVNILRGDLAWGSTDPKFWSLAPGSELQLNNNTSVEVNGNHTVFGGGSLRVKGTMTIGQSTTANPAFILNEGAHIVDGGTFTSRGGYRIGSAAGGSGATTIVSNGGSFNLTVSGANLRVGDSANPITSRLLINNASLTMAGGILGVPFAAGATGEVGQVGGVVSGAIVTFSQGGAGSGTYGITNGVLEAIQIRKGTAAGLGRLYLDNATIRTAPAADNDFFAGLNLAEIESGGLVLDAQTDVTIAQALSGNGPLIKSNLATITLTGTNTYSGNTTIQSGKLGLPTVQTNSTTVQVANGAELGVNLSAPGTTLTTSGLNFAGASFGTLSFDLGGFETPTVPLVRVNSLSVSGPVTVNVANTPQLTGQFVLVDYSGGISGGFQFTLGSLPPGVTATLVNNVANSSIDLKITGPAAGPLITSVLLSGNNLIFSGTDGVQGNSYIVWSSTNLASSAASWVPVSTNVFGPGGTFSVTNAIDPGKPVNFYRLSVP